MDRGSDEEDEAEQSAHLTEQDELVIASAAVLDAVVPNSENAVDKRPGITAADLEKLASEGDTTVSALTKVRNQDERKRERSGLKDGVYGRYGISLRRWHGDRSPTSMHGPTPTKATTMRTCFGTASYCVT